VTDQQGGAVPGAQVQLIEGATNTTLTTTSNNDGRYVFVDVPVGTYTLTFTKPGFETYRVDQQAVEVGSALTVNARLQVGSTTTTVEVQAVVGAELQTSNAAVGSTISGQAILDLPNLGRDVSTLAVLQPGSTMGGYTAGAVFDQNTYMIDGGNTSDDMAGNTIGYQVNFTGMAGVQTSSVPSGVVPVPVESVEEFKVSTFNQTADFNNSIGSEVQMATKRGTKDFHGSVYGYYYATNIGAANTWTNNHTCKPFIPAADCLSISSPTNGTGSFPLPGFSNPLPSNHRDRFGASLGGPAAPSFLGGKWFFFFNYEGLRYPNVSTYERTVPTALMRAGVIQQPNSAGVWVPYNLNPVAVTVNGVTYQPAVCGPINNPVACDPRGIGLNPIVNQIWSKFMPLPNDPIYSGGDLYNTQGYLSTIRAPLTSDTYVGRIDHDFNDKNRFMASYRYLNLQNLTTNQVDIGGALAGDTFGNPTPVAPRPQKPSFFVTGLTTNLTPNMINDFRFSFLRNFWQWSSQNDPPQLPGLGGAVEIGGESTSALIPYNVNTQNTRQRFWDGHDYMYRDDITLIHGNHLFQFGGSYQRNFDYHLRTDNGNGINDQVVYQVTSSGITFPSTLYPSTLPSSQQSSYQTLFSEVTGMVSIPQVAYTRAGTNLALQPIGTPAYDKDVIPYYQEYFGDTWHMKPNFTLSYSLGYTIEMPPYELNGKQVEQVDPAGNLITTANYLANRVNAALAGSTYDPVLGFELVRNVGTGLKYPYNPFYGEFSPRVSAAWNPKFSSGILGKFFGDGKTVLRGGYGRIWGRLNGVNQVLVPLLGPGLIQPVTCSGAVAAFAAQNGSQCLGSGTPTPSTAFRIGVDGNVAPLPAAAPTLPQPYFPGVNGATAGDTTSLDPNYKPERTDNFDFSIQRELSKNMTIEVGYLGRIIRNEYQEINLDAVPYMTTLGGQSFSQAFAATYTALYNLTTGASTGAAANSIPVQPFFETALGGMSNAFCQGTTKTPYTSCTAAIAGTYASDFANTRVSDLWRSLNGTNGWILGRTMISSPITSNAGLLNSVQATSMSMVTSLGYGNYNALFMTWRARNWKGLTALANFTYSRSLGTSPLAQYNSANTANNPYNLQSGYGASYFDIPLTFNLAMSYQAPYYRTQKGLLGHILGGWTFSPLFYVQSGAPFGASYSEINCTACQAFGEVGDTAASVSTITENAVLAYPYTGGDSAHYNVPGGSVNGTAVATNNPTGLNFFSNPALVYSEFRRCVLGIDTSCGAYGQLRGLPFFNLDASLFKDVGIWKEGRIGASLSIQVTNVLNHFQPAGPASLSLTSPTNFGKITGQGNVPRQMEFGLRIHF
jgi:hypothetical protein